MTLAHRKILVLIIIVALCFLAVSTLAETLSGSLWADTNMCSDIDPKTGLTCDEIDENPGQDVYYVVDAVHFEEDIWDHAHQQKDTVRWNVPHTKFILKYDASSIPREKAGLLGILGVPMNHGEILAHLDDPLNGFYDPFDPPPGLPIPPEEVVPEVLVEEPILEEAVPEDPIIESPVDEGPIEEVAETDNPSDNPDQSETNDQGDSGPTEEGPTTESGGEVLGEEAVTETPEEDTQDAGNPEDTQEYDADASSSSDGSIEETTSETI